MDKIEEVWDFSRGYEKFWPASKWCNPS